jgi:hypothetical protein
MRNLLKEELHVLLLELRLLSLQTLVEPVRILNLGDRIHAFLESCRDCHNFHDSAGNTLLIVVPVDKLTHVKVLESIVFKPFAKELLLDSLICFENGCGNSSICHFSFDWQLGNDKLHIETLVFHDFRSKKFGETLSASDRCTFLPVIIT